MRRSGLLDYAWQHHGDPEGEYSGLVRVDDGVPQFVSMHGMYVPSCAMYEGETVELQHGEYTWDRFTDTRSVDDSGNLVDPFPDHPMTGSYERQGTKVSMKLTNSGADRSFVLLATADSAYLLTTDEHDAFLASGEIARCALQRRENSPE